MKMISKIKEYFVYIILGIFAAIAYILHLTAKIFKLTYSEVNILLYYLIIPLTWCIMIDIIIKLPIFTILWLILWMYIFISKRKFFREWCDTIFDLSVIFLLKFNKLGWDYYLSSVIICVIVPLIIYLILFIFVV
jgi:hypothetical protein